MLPAVMGLESLDSATTGATAVVGDMASASGTCNFKSDLSFYFEPSIKNAPKSTK